MPFDLGGMHMRHCYVRFTLGLTFIACLIFSLVTMNLPFAALYLALGIGFLSSAYALWKKDRDERR